MNLVADESVDHPIIARLRLDGHQVIAIAELSPSIPDDAVLLEANNRGALLVTGDKDFGELVFRQRRLHTGVVLIRLSGLAPAAKAVRVSAVFRDHAAELAGAFSVITPRAVRIRRVP